MEQVVILVDESDNPIGLEEKMSAHSNGGKLHRALSIFVFNEKGETMLQRRADTKYHSAGQWSNTACSHQMLNESTIDAAHRRLQEEMGFDCRMQEVFNFPYTADVGKGLTEREYDHILFGWYDQLPHPNPKEVSDWRWISFTELKKELSDTPDSFTPWLRLMVDDVEKNYRKLKQ